MSHEPNAPELPAGAAAAALEAPVGTGEPVPDFVARAARILSDDIRPEDYLPVPDEVRAAVADAVRQIEADNGFEVTTEGKQRILNDWVLCHHYDGEQVLARCTPDGVLVLAAGGQQIGQVNRRFNPDSRSGFALMFPSTAW